MKKALVKWWNKLRPSIPNLNLNVQVRIQVGTSFSQFLKFNFNVIFCNFWKVWNRTNFEYSVISECSETPVFDPNTPVFDPKTPVFATKPEGFDPNLFLNYFCKIFASSKRPDISEKVPNFDNRTIPKLAKTKSLENSVFHRALK